MIYGQRAALRPLLDSDMPYILSWNEDPEVRRLVEGDYPGTVETAPAWAREVRRNRQKRYYIITVDAHPIGDVELDHIAWRSGEAELRIRIGEKRYWNQGYGTDVILTLLRYAFTELGLQRIYLRVFSDNQRAINCYRKCGFAPEGTLEREGEDGRPRRIILMSLRRDRFFARVPRILSA